MKNRLVSALLLSLVASLSFAIACSGGGRSSTRKKDGGSISFDSGTGDSVDLKKADLKTSAPDFSDPGTGELSCQEFFTCLGDCGSDTACGNACFDNTSATGQSQFGDLYNCLANTCVGTGECEVNSAGDALIDSPTCDTCLNADSTWNECAAEVNACE